MKYTLNEILDAIAFMEYARDHDVEDWQAGMCEDIAKSIYTLSENCKVFEIRTDELRGMHFYVIVDGVSINEGLPYSTEDWGDSLRHDRVKVTPGLCSWGEELKYLMDEFRKGDAKKAIKNYQQQYGIKLEDISALEEQTTEDI